MACMNDTPFIRIENAAHGGAFGDNAIPEPTEAQCMAGNYKMGRVSLYGLPLVIEQPRNSYRTGTDANGKRWTSRMAAHYGYIGGTKGADGDAVDCFIGFYPQSELVFVINQNVGGRFDEHKVMLGFPDEESARRAYLGSYDRGWPGLASIIPLSISQLKWWLKHGDMSRPLRDNLPPEGLETMTRKVQWDSDALPYDSTLDHILYEIRCADAGEGLLMDAVTALEIADDSEGVLAFDALVSPYAKLERKMELLRGVMERTGDKVKPVAMQITEPFKQRGVANVAAIFELSDGQTVSIYFHNPDSTPSKMAPTDEVISWKWLLNKKDITIVVAPERGNDLSVREVARRIMRLAEKNSPAFQRANAKRAERMGAIQGLKDEISGLESELAAAQHELEVAKVEAEDAAARPARNPAQEKRDLVLSGKTAIMSDRELNGWIDDDMPGDVVSMPNPDQAGTLDQWMVGLKSNPDMRAARVAAGIEPPEPKFAVGQRVRFGAGIYDGSEGIIESINPDTGRMVVRGPQGTGFGVAPANAIAWKLTILEGQVPFHKMTPEQQRAAMAAEKAAVSDGQVDQFLSGWGGVTADYLAAGHRVAGHIVGGSSGAYRVEGSKIETVSRDGMSATHASAGQVDELRDAIRGGQVQVELYRRWGGSVDSSSPIKVLHQASGKFKPFEGKFELPGLSSDAGAQVDYTKMFDPSVIKEMNVIKHLHDSVLAAKHEGNSETVIESDRILSLFVDTLTPQQFKNYDHDKAEEALFYKLRGIEKELGLGDPAVAPKDFDPTTPEGYAKVRDDESLQLHWQDRLDAFFQGRIVDVRNAMRALGWESREPHDARLYRDGMEAQPTFTYAGAGKNVVGWAMNEIPDDLTKTPEQYAAEVDSQAVAEVARRAQATADADAGADGQQALIDAYVGSFSDAAAALNAAVAAVDKDAITDTASANAEIAKLRDAARVAQHDIIGKAAAGLESAGFNTWDERLAGLNETAGFAAWNSALDAYQAATNDLQATGKERLKEAGAAALAALPADAPLSAVALAVYRKHGIDMAARSDWLERIAGAIDAKDAETLRSVLAGVGSDSNKASMEVFERATGVKLAKTQRDRAAQIDDWAGITPERRAEIEAGKDAAWQESERTRKVKDAWDMLKRMNVRNNGTGTVSDGQQYLLGQVADGYSGVGTFKRGAATVYGLKKGGDLVFVNNRTFTGFLKAALAFGDLRVALETVGAAPAPTASPEGNGTDASVKVALVDAVYQFDSATDDFKAWLADSVGRTENSPFVTARAMDEAAKRAGAGVQWGIFAGAALDDAGAAIAALEQSLEVVETNEPINRAAGDDAQAQLEADTANSIREAITTLTEADYVPDEEDIGGTFEAEAVTLDSIALDAAGAALTKKQAAVVDFIKHQLGIDLSGLATNRGSNKWFNVDTSDPSIAHKMRQIESLGLSSGRYRIESNGGLGHAFHLTNPSGKALDGAALDAVGSDGYVGKVVKDGDTAGRISIDEAGNATVYVGADGAARVEPQDGQQSGDGAARLVDALLAPAAASAADQAVPELIAAGFKRVLKNDYVRAVSAGDKKLQFNVRVTDEGFIVRLTVGFSGGITGAATEIGRTADVGAAIALVDAEVAKRSASKGQTEPANPESQVPATQNEYPLGKTQEDLSDEFFGSRVKIDLGMGGQWTGTVYNSLKHGRLLEVARDGSEHSRIRVRGEQVVAVHSLVRKGEAELSPAAGPDPQKDADRALFKSVIDGAVADILAPELADDLEAAYTRNQDDAELTALFEQAVTAYQAAMMAATSSL